jgi:hypothetical protein
MAADDSIRIRVGMSGASGTARDAKKVSRAVDEIGDQARQAARSLGKLNRASATTRVNFGPFSTSMKGGALAIGALVNAGRAGIPVVLSLTEAVTTMAGGVGAAGAVGLTGLAQAAGVAKLGMGGLMDALGGNQTALKKLSPEVRALFDQLHGAQTKLQGTAQRGMLPGLEAGTQSALRNLPVLNRIVGKTARTLGNLAQRGGNMLGSAEWAADIKKLGGTNVRIIDHLGTAGLHLAGALKDILVSAAPLAEWLAKNADEGARLLEVWIGSERASGGMARFFKEAKADLQLLGQIGGHTGRGIINIFGASDVNGTKTLESINKITMRFEEWTRSGALKDGFGQALVDQAPVLGGKLVSALADGMAAAVPVAAHVFWNGFWNASVAGKLLTAGFIAKKFGAFKGAGGLLGIGGGIAGASLKKPLPVFVVNEMPGGGGLLGSGKERARGAGRLGRLLRTGVTAAGAVASPEVVAAAGAGYVSWRLAHRNAGPMVRPSEPNLDPSRVMSVGDRRRAAELEVAPVYMDGEQVGQITARVRRRRQASN